MSEEIKCKEGHTWNGILPTVDEKILEPQHPDLEGLPCDCKKLLFHEEICGCPGKKEWRIKTEENPNYGQS